MCTTKITEISLRNKVSKYRSGLTQMKLIVKSMKVGSKDGLA